ncbi:hypothetical protein EVAR_37254_1 [Eumeta japonica]|uniref:Uncharacterized protein n=1 Tax=Eumeta variegata TaxID=151549 RepID=A0A4C1WJ24_EUMVA|nr:hypothetical protein EVAR_37254_1 [Eumeta japonica]
MTARHLPLGLNKGASSVVLAVVLMCERYGLREVAQEAIARTDKSRSPSDRRSPRAPRAKGVIRSALRGGRRRLWV